MLPLEKKDDSNESSTEEQIVIRYQTEFKQFGRIYSS